MNTLLNTLTDTFLRARFSWIIVLLMSMTAVQADQDDVLTVRTDQSFATTLDNAAEILEKHGFTVAHVQKCDGGLQQMGYESDHYRVIFFGRLEEVRQLSKTHPALIPLFPFKLAVYADNNDSVISVINPASLEVMLPADPKLKAQLQQWEQEFTAVLEEIMTQRQVAGL